MVISLSKKFKTPFFLASWCLGIFLSENSEIILGQSFLLLASILVICLLWLFLSIQLKMLALWPSLMCFISLVAFAFHFHNIHKSDLSAISKFVDAKGIKLIRIISQKNLSDSGEYIGHYLNYSKTGSIECLLEISLTGDVQVDIGSTIATYVPISVYRSPKIPGEFDFAAYMNKKGIGGKVELSESSWVTLEKTASLELEERIALMRLELSDRLMNVLGKTEGFAIVQALVLGDRSELTKKQQQNFRQSGSSHLLAVSGMHIGVMALVVHLFLFHVLQLRRRSKAYTALLCGAIWLYALLAGFSPSVQRASTLLSVIALSRLFDRRIPVTQSLYLCLLLILISNTALLFDLSFQLSALATISILELGPILKSKIANGNKWFENSFLMVEVSIAAQLGVFGLCVYYFHQFQGLFIVSNLMLTPLVTLLMYSGLI